MNTDDVQRAAYELACRGRIQYLAERHFKAIQELRVAYHHITDLAEEVGVESLEDAKEAAASAWHRSRSFADELEAARRIARKNVFAIGFMLGAGSCSLFLALMLALGLVR